MEHATIFGVSVPAIPEGAVAVEAIVLVKAIDADGEPTIFLRSSDGLAPWDMVGVLVMAADIERERAASGFLPLADEEG